MLVFSTRLPLKPDVSRETCIRLFIEWITKSEHYPMTIIDYDVSSRDDFETAEDGVTFAIRHYRDERVELSACRLSKRGADALWISDCVFLQEGGGKSLLIQLSCDSLLFSAQLPRVHKPYIVRMFVEGGYCRDDAGIPVTDEPLEADGDYFETCAAIMRGEYPNTMPVVYLSADYWDKTALNPGYMARQLSGVAHVFYEKSRATARRLREATGGVNAHSGYVGVYFPGTALCQKHALDNTGDFRRMSAAVIESVWKALVNRLDASLCNWNQILVLQARQRMLRWQGDSAEAKEELAYFMSTFDEENKSLREQIDELNQETYSLQAQLDALRAASRETKGGEGFFRPGEEQELYPSERSDLLRSILSQVQTRFEKDSRADVLIQSMLDANPRGGECRKTVATVRAVLTGGGRLSGSDKSRLRAAGFVIEEGGSHLKLTFRGDPRYLFTLACTPSDHRGGSNIVSDICRALDVEKKI